MNLFDKILVCLFFLAILVWQALHQGHLFKQNKTISHFWKGVWYGLAIIVATVPYIAIFDWWYLLKILIIAVVERLAFFDLILNIARGYAWWYNGSITIDYNNPNQQKGSLIDRIENILTIQQVKILKIIYVILFMAAVIRIK